MNVYIYDSFINEKKYANTVAKIETRITDLGLNGKIIRLNALNSAFDFIENELKKGLKTLVAVGNLRLLSQCVNTLAFLSGNNPAYREVPLGFIPVGKKNNEIADFFGIGRNEAACENISARRIQSLDLGLVNDDKYFFSYAQIPTAGTIVEINTDYSIEIKRPGRICALNLPFGVSAPPAANINAQDGRLELLIEEKNGGFLDSTPFKTSIFAFNSLKITNKNHKLLLDTVLETETPARIRIAREKLKIIVGKNRGF